MTWSARMTMPPRNDGPGLADERLRPIEQERPLMDTCGEVDRWRERCPADCPGDNECAGSSHERSYADLVELAATFGVRKREDRESCLGECLCEQPCHPEEGQRADERRCPAEGTDEADHEHELEKSQRESQPPRLILDHVVDEDVECKPHDQHQPDEPDRPPGRERHCEDARPE